MRAPIHTAALMLATAASLAAQRVTITMTGGTTANFPTPAVADYMAGSMDDPIPITFTLTTNNWAQAATTVTATVEICATTANLGNGKPVSDLKWRPADLSLPFQPMIQGCTAPISPARTVLVHQMTKNTSWTPPGVLLQVALNWATDIRASYGTTVRFTLTAVTP